MIEQKNIRMIWAEREKKQRVGIQKSQAESLIRTEYAFNDYIILIEIEQRFSVCVVFSK